MLAAGHFILALVAGFQLKMDPIPLEGGQTFSLLEAQVEPAPQINGANSLPIELMRYITPYQENMDVETDITQHMPLIRNQNSLSLYSFIDTWVGGRPSSFIWMNSTANQCMTMTQPDNDNGNGFDVKASLHFYEAPRTDGYATKVVPVVSPTPFGNFATLGELVATEAVLEKGATVSAQHLPKCAGGECAAPASVYKCEFPSAGNCVHQLRNSFKEMDEFGGMSLIEREASGRVHRSDLSDTRDVVAQVDSKQRLFKVRLDKADVGKTWNKGDLVFAPKRQPKETEFFGREMGDSPLTEAGVVESVDPAGSAIVRFSPGECIPNPVQDAIDSRAWKVAVATGGQSSGGKNSPASALKLGKALEGNVSTIGADGAASMDHSYVVTPEATGNALLQMDSSLEQMVGSKVVLLAPSSPRLVSTTVDLGEPLKPNERYIAHFVSTGHGWEHTENQCGEFCKVNYKLTLDEASLAGEGYSLLERATEAATFNLWRDDCGSNPLSDQEGTWTTDRNGWCPGSVSNGYFADVTSLVQQGGLHKIGVEATVDGSEPYVNTMGFAYKDPSKLEMSLNFFRYTESDHANHSFVEYASFIEKERPVSFVEFARGLKIDTEAMAEPEPLARNASFVETDMVGKHAASAHAHQNAKAKVHKKTKYSGGRLGDQPDYTAFLGANAPWFTYDGDLRKPPDVVVPLFSGIIHQSSNRIIMGDVPVPLIAGLDPNKNYNVGLRLQLLAPPTPLSVDKWDRYATFGLFMPDPSQPAVVAA